ncbi:MMPL family transporter, partial [Bacteroides fragilis]|nr:MMPL family transporter [Bacteroides fragilis]
DSTVTQEKMMERFGNETDAMSAPSATITVQAPEGEKLSDKEVMGEVDSMIEELQGTDALRDSTVTQEKMMERFGNETDAMSAPSATITVQAPE